MNLYFKYPTYVYFWHTFHMDIVYVCSHRTGNRLPFNHFFNSGLLALFKDDNSLQMLSVCVG